MNEDEREHHAEEDGDPRPLCRYPEKGCAERGGVWEKRRRCWAEGWYWPACDGRRYL